MVAKFKGIDFSFRLSTGERISARAFLVSGKKPEGFCLFSHAFGANKEAIWEKHFVPVSLSKGFSAVSFDYPGCGKSSGKFEETAYSRDIEALRIALAESKRRFSLSGRPILVGHSRGGATALLFSAKKKARAIFLLAPRSEFKNNLSAFSEDVLRLWKKMGTMEFFRPFPHKMNYSYFLDLARRAKWKRSPIDLARKIECPAEIVHSRDDASIHYSESVRLQRKIKGSRLVLISGADHFFRGCARDFISREFSSFLSKVRDFPQRVKTN